MPRFNERGEIINDTTPSDHLHGQSIPPAPPIQWRNNLGKNVAMGIGVIVILFACFGLSNSLQDSFTVTASATASTFAPSEIGFDTSDDTQVDSSRTALPTFTSAPRVSTSLGPTSSPTRHSQQVTILQPTSTKVSTPKIIVENNTQDGTEMVFVPAGEFTMGLNADETSLFWGAEGPEHIVYVDDFWIYRTEVTNAMYQRCVDAHACPRPEQFYSRTRTSYYNAPEYTNYPVIYVTWVDALTYCQWANGRLPTEAEWEKAARGDDSRYFPWGFNEPASDLLNLCGKECPASERSMSIDDGYPDTAPVASFPKGTSPYGAFDMAGNVWEWTMDYFEIDYYSHSPAKNPTGPADGTRRVIRGGSWTNYHAGVWTAFRASLKPSNSLDTLGFRCVIPEP